MYFSALARCVFAVFLCLALLRRGSWQQILLPIGNSHVTPTSAFITDENIVTLLPVEVFLDVICWVTDTDCLRFHSLAALSCETIVADSGWANSVKQPQNSGPHRPNVNCVNVHWDLAGRRGQIIESLNPDTERDRGATKFTRTSLLKEKGT